MNVSIIGTGYVGLVTGVCFANKGFNVICVDNDSNKIEKIRKGISPIYEDKLDYLLNKNIGVNLSVTGNLTEAVIKTDVTFIAVGTPFNNNKIDLSYLSVVTKEIALAIKQKQTKHFVIVKSTVTPGTTDSFVTPILEKYSTKKLGLDFGVGMNPEFLREGVAVDDFMNPDRIVLGASDVDTHNTLSHLYGAFTVADIIKTNNINAEMIKYASNSLLATLISFSNEIGNLCSILDDADALQVMEGVHLDKRISPILEKNHRVIPEISSYLKVGCGFGGSCFPKDVNALISFGANNKQSMDLLRAVMKINYQQPYEIMKLLEKHYQELEGLNVTILGLAFKPGTDDMRESPAIPIIKELSNKKAILKVFDPVVENQAKEVFKNIKLEYFRVIEDALINSKAVLLLTSWPEFQNLPKIFKDMKINPLLIDGRRIINGNSIEKYEGVGKGKNKH